MQNKKLFDALDQLDEARAYIKALEEAVRAILWSDNYITNEGASVTTYPNDAYRAYNERVDRANKAFKNLPPYLWDEVGAENAIIYNGMHEDREDLSKEFALLLARGLIPKPDPPQIED